MDSHPIQPLYAAMETLSALADHLSTNTYSARWLRQDTMERIDELLTQWETVAALLGIEGCASCFLGT